MEEKESISFDLDELSRHSSLESSRLFDSGEFGDICDLLDDFERTRDDHEEMQDNTVQIKTEETKSLALALKNEDSNYNDTTRAHSDANETKKVASQNMKESSASSPKEKEKMELQIQADKNKDVQTQETNIKHSTGGISQNESKFADDSRDFSIDSLEAQLNFDEETVKTSEENKNRSENFHGNHDDSINCRKNSIEELREADLDASQNEECRFEGNSHKNMAVKENKLGRKSDALQIELNSKIAAKCREEEKNPFKVYSSPYNADILQKKSASSLDNYVGEDSNEDEEEEVNFDSDASLDLDFDDDKENHYKTENKSSKNTSKSTSQGSKSVPKNGEEHDDDYSDNDGDSHDSYNRESNHSDVDTKSKSEMVVTISAVQNEKSIKEKLYHDTNVRSSIDIHRSNLSANNGDGGDNSSGGDGGDGSGDGGDHSSGGDGGDGGDGGGGGGGDGGGGDGSVDGSGGGDDSGDGSDGARGDVSSSGSGDGGIIEDLVGDGDNGSLEDEDWNVGKADVNSGNVDNNNRNDGCDVGKTDVISDTSDCRNDYDDDDVDHKVDGSCGERNVDNKIRNDNNDSGDDAKNATKSIHNLKNERSVDADSNPKAEVTSFNLDQNKDADNYNSSKNNDDDYGADPNCNQNSNDDKNNGINVANVFNGIFNENNNNDDDTNMVCEDGKIDEIINNGTTENDRRINGGLLCTGTIIKLDDVLDNGVGSDNDSRDNKRDEICDIGAAENDHRVYSDPVIDGATRITTNMESEDYKSDDISNGGSEEENNPTVNIDPICDGTKIDSNFDHINRKNGNIDCEDNKSDNIRNTAAAAQSNHKVNSDPDCDVKARNTKFTDAKDSNMDTKYIGTRKKSTEEDDYSIDNGATYTPSNNRYTNGNDDDGTYLVSENNKRNDKGDSGTIENDRGINIPQAITDADCNDNNINENGDDTYAVCENDKSNDKSDKSTTEDDCGNTSPVLNGAARNDYLKTEDDCSGADSKESKRNGKIDVVTAEKDRQINAAQVCNDTTSNSDNNANNDGDNACSDYKSKIDDNNGIHDVSKDKDIDNETGIETSGNKVGTNAAQDDAASNTKYDDTNDDDDDGWHESFPRKDDDDTSIDSERGYNGRNDDEFGNNEFQELDNDDGNDDGVGAVRDGGHGDGGARLGLVVGVVNDDVSDNISRDDDDGGGRARIDNADVDDRGANIDGGGRIDFDDDDYVDVDDNHVINATEDSGCVGDHEVDDASLDVSEDDHIAAAIPNINDDINNSAQHNIEGLNHNYRRDVDIASNDRADHNNEFGSISNDNNPNAGGHDINGNHAIDENGDDDKNDDDTVNNNNHNQATSYVDTNKDSHHYGDDENNHDDDKNNDDVTVSDYHHHRHQAIYDSNNSGSDHLQNAETKTSKDNHTIFTSVKSNTSTTIQSDCSNILPDIHIAASYTGCRTTTSNATSKENTDVEEERQDVQEVKGSVNNLLKKLLKKAKDRESEQEDSDIDNLSTVGKTKHEKLEGKFEGRENTEHDNDDGHFSMSKQIKARKTEEKLENDWKSIQQEENSADNGVENSEEKGTSENNLYSKRAPVPLPRRKIRSDSLTSETKQLDIAIVTNEIEGQVQKIPLSSQDLLNEDAAAFQPLYCSTPISPPSPRKEATGVDEQVNKCKDNKENKRKTDKIDEKIENFYEIPVDQYGNEVYDDKRDGNCRKTNEYDGRRGDACGKLRKNEQINKDIITPKEIKEVILHKQEDTTVQYCPFEDFKKAKTVTSSFREDRHVSDAITSKQKYSSYKRHVLTSCNEEESLYATSDNEYVGKFSKYKKEKRTVSSSKHIRYEAKIYPHRQAEQTYEKGRNETRVLSEHHTISARIGDDELRYEQELRKGDFKDHLLHRKGNILNSNSGTEFSGKKNTSLDQLQLERNKKGDSVFYDFKKHQYFSLAHDNIPTKSSCYYRDKTDVDVENGDENFKEDAKRSPSFSSEKSYKIYSGNYDIDGFEAYSSNRFVSHKPAVLIDNNADDYDYDDDDDGIGKYSSDPNVDYGAIRGYLNHDDDGEFMEDLYRDEREISSTKDSTLSAEDYDSHIDRHEPLRIWKERLRNDNTTKAWTGNCTTAISSTDHLDHDDEQQHSIENIRIIKFPLSRHGPGIVLETKPDIIVKELVAGCDAFQDGRLLPGDRLLSINGYNLSFASLEQANSVLRKLHEDPSERFATIRLLRNSSRHSTDLYETDSTLDKSITLPSFLSESPSPSGVKAARDALPIQHGTLLQPVVKETIPTQSQAFPVRNFQRYVSNSAPNQQVRGFQPFSKEEYPVHNMQASSGHASSTPQRHEQFRPKEASIIQNFQANLPSLRVMNPRQERGSSLNQRGGNFQPFVKEVSPIQNKHTGVFEVPVNQPSQTHLSSGQDSQRNMQLLLGVPLLTSTPVTPKVFASSEIRDNYAYSGSQGRGISDFSTIRNIPSSTIQHCDSLLMISPGTHVHLSKLESALSYLGLDLNDYQKHLLRIQLRVDSQGYVVYEEFARSARYIYNSTLGRRESRSLCSSTSTFSPLPDIIPQAYIQNVITRKMDELVQEKDHIKEEIARIKRNINKRSEKLSSVEIELAEVRRDLEKARQRRSNLQKKNAELERAKIKVTTKANDYQYEVRSLEREITNLKLANVPVTTRAVAKCAAVEKQIHNLVKRLRTVEKSNKNFHHVTQKLIAFAYKVQRAASEENTKRVGWHDSASSSDHTYQVVVEPRPSSAPDTPKGIRKVGKREKFLSEEARKIISAVEGILSQQQLPYGWEEAYTEKGQRFFMDHVTGTTTWMHPLTKKADTRPHPRTGKMEKWTM